MSLQQVWTAILFINFIIFYSDGYFHQNDPIIKYTPHLLFQLFTVMPLKEINRSIHYITTVKKFIFEKKALFLTT